MKRFLLFWAALLVASGVAYAGCILEQTPGADQYVNVPVFQDSNGTDAGDLAAGLTITAAEVYLSKNGGTFAAKNDAGACTEDTAIPGHYRCPIDSATDLNTAGWLAIVIEDGAGTSSEVPVFCQVLVTQAYDSFYGTDNLEVDVTYWEGELVPEATGTGIPQVDVQYVEATAQTSVDLADFADAGYDPSTNKVQGVVLVDDITTKTGYTASPTAGSITNTSLGGNLEIVYETDFVTNYNTTRNAWETNLTDTIGALVGGEIGVGAFTTAAITADAIATNALGDLEVVDTALGEATSNWATAVGFSTLTASDNIGINWGDVSNPTTSVGLSGTTIGTVTTTTTASTCTALGAGAVNNTSTTLTETLNCDVVAGGIAAGDVATGGIEAGDFAANAITDAAVANDVQIDVLTIETGDATAALDTAADTVTMTAATAAGVQDLFTVDSGETSASAVEGSVVKEAADGVSGAGLTAIATGTAQAGAAGSITLASAETFIADELIGALVQITGGTGDGQSRCIDDYGVATDRADVNANWITNPDNTSTYEIKSGFGLCPDATATVASTILAADCSDASSTADTLGAICTDWENAGRLDTILDAIETDTANMQPKFGAIAGSGQNTILGYVQSIARNDVTVSSDIGGTYDDAQESLEALRARGDAAWTTGSGTGLTGVTGTTQTATHTATAIVLESGEVANDDDFLGWWIQITSGNCAAQKAKVSSSSRATDTVTVQPGLRTDGSGTCTSIDSDLDGVTYELAPYGG